MECGPLEEHQDLIHMRREEFETLYGGMSEAINSLWLITSAVNILVMQLGFSLLEVGSVSSRNTANILVKNLFDTFLGSLAYFTVGSAFANDARGGVIGNGRFFCEDFTSYDYTKWLWEFSFCTTSATIVSGCLAERTFVDTYIMFSIIMAAFIFPVCSSWVWGGGWLQVLGFKDFAGSGVVHLCGAAAALAAVSILGPRKGKYGN